MSNTLDDILKINEKLLASIKEVKNEYKIEMSEEYLELEEYAKINLEKEKLKDQINEEYGLNLKKSEYKKPVKKVIKSKMTKRQRLEKLYNSTVLKKVYKIICDDVDECYVGSTCYTLEHRLKGHISSYKKWKDHYGDYVSSFIMFEKYGVGNCKIVLLEENINYTLDELLKREQFWIDNLDTVNETNPTNLKKRKINVIKYNGSKIQKKLNDKIIRILNNKFGKETVIEHFGENPQFETNYEKICEINKQNDNNIISQ